MEKAQKYSYVIKVSLKKCESELFATLTGTELHDSAHDFNRISYNVMGAAIPNINFPEFSFELQSLAPQVQRL